MAAAANPPRPAQPEGRGTSPPLPRPVTWEHQYLDAIALELRLIRVLLEGALRPEQKGVRK
jgi:hypothetical protein